MSVLLAVLTFFLVILLFLCQSLLLGYVYTVGL